jgi:hypothetical protein
MNNPLQSNCHRRGITSGRKKKNLHNNKAMEEEGNQVFNM